MCWWWSRNFSVKISGSIYLLSAYVSSFFQKEFPKLFLKLLLLPKYWWLGNISGDFLEPIIFAPSFRQCLLKALSKVVAGRWVGDVVTLYSAGGHPTIHIDCQRNLTISKKDIPNLRLSLGCRPVIFLLSASPSPFLLIIKQINTF